MLFGIEYAISLLFLVAAIMVPLSIGGYLVKIILFFIAMVFDVLAFTSRHYAYLFVPFIKGRGKRVILSNDDAYYLSASADSILKKVGEKFIATVYIMLPVYTSSTEMTDDQKLEFTQKVSRMVGITRDPARFTTEVLIMNKDDYLRELKDAISQADNEVAQLNLNKNPDKKRMEHYKGKSVMLRNLLNDMGKVTSYEEISYVTVSAYGYKEYEAVANAQQKARELISGISSVFGVPVSIITGNELLKFVEPEYLIPYVTVTTQMNSDLESKVI